MKLLYQSTATSPYKTTVVVAIISRGPKGILEPNLRWPRSKPGKAMTKPKVEAANNASQAKSGLPISRPSGMASLTSPKPIHLPSDTVCNTKNNPLNRKAAASGITTASVTPWSAIKGRKSEKTRAAASNEYTSLLGKINQRKSYQNKALINVQTTIQTANNPMAVGVSTANGHTSHEPAV